MERMSCSTMRGLGCGGSFSFSCSDSDLNFSSALSHFTDDAGDDAVVEESDVEDEESYIEIALDHQYHHPKATVDDDGGGDRLDHVDYLRISFSSSFPFPDYSDHTIPNDTNIVSEDPAGAVKEAASSSSTTSLSASSISVEDFRGSDHELKIKRSKLPAVNRLVNTLFYRLWSPDTTAKKVINDAAQVDYNISHLQSHVDNDDFVQTRKASYTRTTMNGGIMKLLFKFRAMNLGTMVASFVKPRKVVCSPDQDYCHLTNGRRKVKKPKAQSTLHNQKPLDKCFVQKKQGKPGMKKKNSLPEVRGGEKSRVLEIKMNKVKGILEAIGSSMSTGVGRKERRTRSCPSSIKSSPIHVGYADQSKLYARETSIQAAIAHCNFSFEQLS